MKLDTDEPGPLAAGVDAAGTLALPDDAAGAAILALDVAGRATPEFAANTDVGANVVDGPVGFFNAGFGAYETDGPLPVQKGKLGSGWTPGY